MHKVRHRSGARADLLVWIGSPQAASLLSLQFKREGHL